MCHLKDTNNFHNTNILTESDNIDVKLENSCTKTDNSYLPKGNDGKNYTPSLILIFNYGENYLTYFIFPGCLIVLLCLIAWLYDMIVCLIPSCDFVTPEFLVRRTRDSVALSVTHNDCVIVTVWCNKLTLLNVLLSKQGIQWRFI